MSIMVTYEDKTKNIVKGLAIITLYFLVSLFNTIPFEVLNINYTKLPLIIKEVYSISIEVLLLVVIFFTFKDQFKNAFDDLKQNHMRYFSNNFKYYLIGLLLMMMSNLVINFMGGSLSGNEDAIRDQFAIAPIFTFISAVFLAPVLEESIFRLSFRNVFENKIIFIFLSGFVFGGLHLITGFDVKFFFLYLISYCSMGFMFAYMLTRTNNIFVSMGFHLMHNGLLMSMQVLIYLFS